MELRRDDGNTRRLPLLAQSSMRATWEGAPTGNDRDHELHPSAGRDGGVEMEGHGLARRGRGDEGAVKAHEGVTLCKRRRASGCPHAGQLAF